MQPSFQAADILTLALKVAAVIAVFLLMPAIPYMMIKIMWRFAEIVMQSPAGTMGYTTAFNAIPSSEAAKLAFSAGELYNMQSIVGNAGTAGFAAMGNFLSTSLLGSGITGFFAAATYCVWCIELYVAGAAAVVLLPASIFKGFDYKIISVIKFIFISSVEIFVGAIIILLITNNSPLATTGGQGTINQILDMMIGPLLLAILLPVTNKIVSSLAMGGGIADNTLASQRAMGGSAIAGKIFGKNDGSSAEIYQRNAYLQQVQNRQNTNIDSGIKD